MPKFSARSISALESCHQDLQTVMHYAIQRVDFTVIEGHRGEERQNKAYDDGFSKLRYPASKHNKKPSMACDIIPYPFKGWNDEDGFTRCAYYILGVADMLKAYGAIEHEVVWGGDWESFKDSPHFELR
jgi:peptidoglycan LD-endopeptidase CwlK